MSALSIEVPFPVFQDRDGQPLENGYIWLGVAYLNPQTNPVIAYYDEALTIPAPQPLRTLNGYISRAGTPAKVYVDGVNFSILVQDSKGSMVYNFPDGSGISQDACGVTYDPPFADSVPYPVCEKLAQTLSVQDFGAVGDGVADDFAAIQSALNAAIAGGKSLIFPPGTYLHSGVINFASQGLRVAGSGLVRLKYTGTEPFGVAVASDSSFTFDVWISNLLIEANNNTYGFYLKNSAHCVFKDIRIINSSEYGAYLEGTVLDTWENLSVSINKPPYPGQTVTMPKYGLYLNGSTLAVQATANTFINPIIEGVTEVGIFLEDGAANTFVGGTSEGNSGTGGTFDGVGIYIGANSPANTFNNTFCEANKGGDLICFGKRNEFLNSTFSSRASVSPFESVKSIIFQAAAEQNRIIGSNFFAAEVVAGANTNIFEYCDSDFKIDDAGDRTQILWTRQLFNGADIVPGIKAGNLANSDPTVLDWYQEGTFTPEFGGTTSDGSIVYDVQTGTFTRIGNTVFFDLRLRVTLINSAPTGSLTIKGLPFVASSAIATYASAIGFWSNLTLPASRVALSAYVVASTSTIRFSGNASGVAETAVDGSGLAATLISISGSYKV